MNLSNFFKKRKAVTNTINKRPNYTPEQIAILSPNEVFVFGSNLTGQHDGGAAQTALNKFGAIYGQGVGLQGQSYAIPTMQGGVETIIPYIDDFIDFARKHPEKLFYVTRIGCGIAGFRDEEIAPLFEKALNLNNVCLPESFWTNKRKEENPLISPEIIDEFVDIDTRLTLKLSKELFQHHMVNSFHGIAHTTRVLFGTYLILLHYKSIKNEMKEAIYLAAVLHDLGRIDDSKCIAHGELSANLYKDKIAEYVSNNNLQNQILDAVKYHSIDDCYCPKEVQNSVIWKVLKDADALDRSRFSRKCDISFLRLDIFNTDLGTQIIDFMDTLPKYTANLKWEAPYTELANCIKQNYLKS